MDSIITKIGDKEVEILCFPDRPKALLDKTVAEIYEVNTKQINQAFKRNLKKFPFDFYFDLSPEEFDSIKKSKKFKAIKHSKNSHKAFTHLGCNMLATTLKSPLATRRSVEIIQIFTEIENGKDPHSNNNSNNNNNNSHDQNLMLKELRALREDLINAKSGPNNFYFPGQSPSSEDLTSSPVASEEGQVFVPEIMVRIESLEEKITHQEGEIKELRSTLATIPSSTSSLVIPSLAEEMYRNRKEINKLKCNFDELHFRLRQLELPFGDEEPKSERITRKEAALLRRLVKKKWKTKKDIMGVWAAFKKKFGLSRYTDLPQDKLREALEWIEKK